MLRRALAIFRMRRHTRSSVFITASFLIALALWSFCAGDASAGWAVVEWINPGRADVCMPQVCSPCTPYDSDEQITGKSKFTWVSRVTNTCDGLDPGVSCNSATISDYYFCTNYEGAIVTSTTEYEWVGCDDEDDDGYLTEGSVCPPPYDCDDDDPKNHPNNKEICGDNKDNNCNDDRDECCPKPGVCEPCTAKSGNPVDVFTGAEEYSSMDLGYPPPSRISLNRSYSSASKSMGAFGFGTNMNYSRSLINGPSNTMISNSIGGMTFIMTWNSVEGGYKYSSLDTIATIDPSGYPSGYRKLDYGDGRHDIYNSSGLLIEEVDNSYTLTFTRQANGNITSMSDSLGKDLTLTMTSFVWLGTRYDLINSATDSLGQSVEYDYSHDGFLKSVTWSDGVGSTPDKYVEYKYVRPTVYDHRMLYKTIDSQGVEHAINTYDDEGRVLEQTSQEGGVFDFSYINNSTVAVTSPYPKVKTTYVFAESGSIESQSEQEPGAQTSYTTSYTRDDDGNTLTETNPAGEVTSYTYTTEGLTNSVIDPSGNETLYYYDASDRLVNTVDPLGNSTLMGYDGFGNMVSMTMPGYSTATTMTYTSLGLLNSTTDPSGITTTYSYDSMGMQNAVTHEYYGVISRSDYDAVGRLINSTDADGNVTSYLYEDMGTKVTVTSPTGDTTVSVYDDYGNLLSLTDPRGNAITYSYTSRDQIMEMMDQSLLRESFSYRDSAANIYHDRPYSMTDRTGRTTVYSYGDAGRYNRTDYISDNEYEEYTYDGAKRMTLARSSVSGDVKYTYTIPSHNFTGLVNSMDTPQGLVDYGYDRGGRRTSMSATVGTGGSADTLDVTYTYNSKGLLNTLVFESSFIKGNPKTRTLSFSYDSSGRRTGISYPSTATASYVYNSSSGELVGIEHSYNSTAFEDMDYTYDSMGIVNSLTRAGVTPLMPGLMNAAYDSANRHTSIEGFDVGALPEYDANGNMVLRDTVAYSYDQKNRLVLVTGTPEGTVDYSYDALDRRVSKVINGTATQYLYDGLNIVAEEDASGGVTAFYVMGLNIDKPLARIETNGDIYYYHADILGSVIALTDEDGAVVTQYNYSPFGVTEAISEGVVQPFRFTGREWDAETGMYFLRARSLATDLKSFTSEDPIRFASGDTNWYRYVGNDPVNNVDPLGLTPGAAALKFLDFCIKRAGKWLGLKPFDRPFGDSQYSDDDGDTIINKDDPDSEYYDPEPKEPKICSEKKPPIIPQPCN